MIHRSTPARHGGGFLKFLSAVLLLTTLVVLGWGVFANWNLDADADGQPDGFTLRVRDPDWWTASKAEAVPLVERGKEYVLAKKQDIWGDGGYVEQGEDWLAKWRAQRAAEDPQASQEGVDDAAATPDDGDAAAAEAGADDPPRAEAIDLPPEATDDGPDMHAHAEHQRSPRLVRLEERIRNAEDHFAEGLEYYRAADPSTGGWTDERAQAATDARDHFLHVRKLLVERGTLEEYRALDGHDPELLKRADELLKLNQKLLYAATKSSGGL